MFGTILKKTIRFAINVLFVGKDNLELHHLYSLSQLWEAYVENIT